MNGYQRTSWTWRRIVPLVFAMITLARGILAWNTFAGIDLRVVSHDPFWYDLEMAIFGILHGFTILVLVIFQITDMPQPHQTMGILVSLICFSLPGLVVGVGASYILGIVRARFRIALLALYFAIIVGLNIISGIVILPILFHGD